MKIIKNYKVNVVIPFVTMADIAFLLLIFLIVTSSTRKMPDIRLTLPEATQFDKISKNENIEITVDPLNRIIYEKDIYLLKDLKTILPDAKQAIINADKQTDFKTVFQVIEILKEKKYEKVSFTVKREATISAGE